MATADYQREVVATSWPTHLVASPKGGTNNAPNMVNICSKIGKGSQTADDALSPPASHSRCHLVDQMPDLNVEDANQPGDLLVGERVLRLLHDHQLTQRNPHPLSQLCLAQATVAALGCQQ